jgi:murein DD-endopeptidase MepM/ murein hydrolase activator NlpD
MPAMVMRSLVSSALVFLLTVGAAAAVDAVSAPILELPVACQIGAACVVQNYVDQDPGPGARDHTCGPLSYDGHEGTDIRVAGRPEMAAGVAVLAAAPGVVRALRGGEADRAASQAGPEAGNAVVLDHGGGWESQYSHLRQGSVAVATGQRVAAGTRLGLIGWSGRAEFPHVEFALRHRGRAIDPFTGAPAGGGCGREPAPLWSPAAQAALAYQAGGLLRAGFAAEAPELARALDGAYDAPLNIRAPALVFWAVTWGLREGDRETIRLIAPDGRTLAEGSGALPRNEAQWLRYIGKKPNGTGFPPGRYRGEYRVTRETGGHRVTVVDVSRAIELH